MAHRAGAQVIAVNDATTPIRWTSHAAAALSGRAVAEVGAFVSRPIAQPLRLADKVAGRDA